MEFKTTTDPNKLAVWIAGAEVGKVSVTSAAGLPVTKLNGNGYGGSDIIKVSTSISLPAVLRGGTGNDTLTSGSGPDIIFGEAGADTITGNGGRDLLIGGADADLIHGNIDDDILIGGTTGYDAINYSNMLALEAIMSEWVRTDRTFAQRVYNISNGTSGSTADNTSFTSRKNGSNYLLVKNGGQNVFDDNVADKLYGDENNDWLLTNNDEGTQNDTLYTGERITDID
jgi:Ca2+-binding RTX toxin-like protein